MAKLSKEKLKALKEFSQKKYLFKNSEKINKIQELIIELINEQPFCWNISISYNHWCFGDEHLMKEIHRAVTYARFNTKIKENKGEK